MALSCSHCKLPMTRCEAETGKCPVCSGVVDKPAAMPQPGVNVIATKILGQLFGKLPVRNLKLQSLF